jgi:hypothetical protein
MISNYTWQDANNFCRNDSENGHLLAVETIAELYAIKNWTNNSGDYIRFKF